MFAHKLISNSSIWPIDMTLSGGTNLGQSESKSDSKEGVLRIPKNSKIRASPSDGFVSYTGHLPWGLSYPSAEMQSVFSTAPTNWALFIKVLFGPVKPELGVIPSGQENYSKANI